MIIFNVFSNNICKCLILSSVIFLSVFDFYAQSNVEKISIDWDKNLEFLINEEKISIPKIKGQDFEQYKPLFYFSQKISKNKINNASLKLVSKQEIGNDVLTYFKIFNVVVSDTLTYNFKTVSARGQSFFNLELFPFIKENGKIYKITEVELQSNYVTVTNNFKKSFATESVLNDNASSWYKIAVKNDGVFKLDFNFLASCGIDVSNLNPNHLNVYGNGSGKLAELNSKPRVDDLAKLAISFVGDGDAEFESNEYFLFNAFGPHKWNNTGAVFRRDLNIYSDNSFYFIRVSSSEPIKRIGQIASTNAAETELVSSYNFYSVYEIDSASLVGGGQRWYGDLFDLELTKTINFSIPNILNSSPVDFISSFASDGSESGSTISFKSGSQTLASTSLPTTSTDFSRKEISFSLANPSSNVSLTIEVNRANASILTYLDKVELNARCNLTFTAPQFKFRDFQSVGAGKIGKFSISNMNSTYFVWDITDRSEPKIINGNLLGGLFSFNVNTDSLREFIVSDNSSYYTPTFIKKVEQQNLHGLGFADLLIVTHPDFLAGANRLAQVHFDFDGTTSHVVTTEQVYNEFSSGMTDPTAIKWFAKMFYDRANGDASQMPLNLLLFGDGTYDPKDRVSGNNYFVPTYQVDNSEDHINALVTDDYFGLLDDNEAISSSDMMDIGVGRMIVSATSQATEMVDKVVQYLKKGLQNSDFGSCATDGSYSCTSYGDWRNKFVQIADDEEYGYFIINDVEPQSNHVDANHSTMNADKLYLDSYQQVTTAGGERYPDVYDAITDRVQRGALLINYDGHGGEAGAAEERVITIPQIESWTNMCNLNLFVSATCEFTKFDDPKRLSAGEYLYLNPKGGAIALMTTTRSVYFNVNTSIGDKLFKNVFLRDANNRPKTFGEIMMLTKNQANSSSNKRSFNLIGDPAIRIALPMYKVVTDSINSFAPNIYVDTLEALSKVTIKGHIEGFDGVILSDFNGIIQPSIFDKKKTIQTLGQNEKSPVLEFETQKNMLYRGKATVTNGKFEFTFIVPKDIRYDYGFGKISLYANSENNDAGGEESRVIVGGVNPNGLNDVVGPEIEMYFNTDQFVSGGLTDVSPTLIVNLFDENGINTVGNGIGHDIMAVLDNNTANPIVLNDYYNANLDTYQSGSVKYKFNDLEVGPHTLTFKAWDVNNNSSESVIEFEVQEVGDFQLRHVLNYPNPFTTSTSFYFEHNQLCSNLEVQIQVFTVSGKLVKTINHLAYNECYRSDGIAWDGRDDFGDQLAKGVYIYKLNVTNPEGNKAEKIEKLVILK
jgi:hypothetical protein